ncbi:MAG TPA: AarF/UbiB family protein [Flavisolibacter sp.]
MELSDKSNIKEPVKGFKYGLYTLLRLGYLLICLFITAIFSLLLFLYKIAGRMKPGTTITGRSLTFLLQCMGPTYIKLGQVASTRPDILGWKLANDLRELQCRVRPMSQRIVKSIIKKEYGPEWQRLFVFFDLSPVASGSIAQVHRAKLFSGEEVAVKVQRPGLKKIMQLDFYFMLACGKFIGRHRRFGHLPAEELIEELRTSILSQLDFDREANDLMTIKDNTQIDYVYLPHVYLPYCRSQVIVMEFIRGLSDKEVDKLPDANKTKLAEAGLRMLFKMIFEDGLIHADLHKGNIFFHMDKIILVDFGLLARLDKKSRMQFRDLFIAMATNNGKSCSRIILETAAAVPSSFVPEAFTAELTNRLEGFAGKSVHDFEVVKFVSMLFELQHKYRIRSSTEFTMTIVSLLMYEGLLKELAPNTDFQQIAMDCLLSVKAAALSSEERAVVFEELKASVQGLGSV